MVDGNKYIMLDWRQNFGKTMMGDAYYDIAKMWHSLIVNHNMVHDDLFTVENAAVIPCRQVLGSYVVKFER